MKILMKKMFDKRLFAAALTLGLCIAISVQALSLCQTVEEVEDGIIRLHIIANSDSEQDQALKIKVRDRLIKEGRLCLSDKFDKEEALSVTEKNLGYFKAAAEDELRKNGCELTVTAEMAKTDFDTRVYGDVTLPAGSYDALRVVIGDGGGKNWWCVMFPPMCISAGCEVQSDGQALRERLTDGGTELVFGGERYKVKFKAAEIYRSVRKELSRIFCGN